MEGVLENTLSKTLIWETEFRLMKIKQFKYGRMIFLDSQNIGVSIGPLSDLK